MRSLVQKLAPAGELAFETPFPVIARATAVAIAGTQVGEWADPPGTCQRMAQPQAGVEPMIVPHLHFHLVLPGEFGEAAQLIGAAGAGLLDQDMEAAANGCCGDHGQRIMGGGDDRHGHAGIRQSLRPRRSGDAARVEGGKCNGARRVGVGAAEQACRAQGGGALAPHEAAANEGHRHAHVLSPQSMPRSRPVIRRSV